MALTWCGKFQLRICSFPNRLRGLCNFTLSRSSTLRLVIGVLLLKLGDKSLVRASLKLSLLQFGFGLLQLALEVGNLVFQATVLLCKQCDLLNGVLSCLLIQLESFNMVTLQLHDILEGVVCLLECLDLSLEQGHFIGGLGGVDYLITYGWYARIIASRCGVQNDN